jgi:hypothetical protein
MWTDYTPVRKLTLVGFVYKGGWSIRYFAVEPSVMPVQSDVFAALTFIERKGGNIESAYGFRLTTII